MRGKTVLVSVVVLLCAVPVVGWVTLPRVRAITPEDPSLQDPTPPAGISEASGLDAGAIGLVNHIGGNAQAVAIQGSYAYVGIGPKLVVLDISNPADLSVVGQVFLPSGVRALGVAGDYGYAATDSDGLMVVDISDPANPVIVGFCDTQVQVKDLAVADGYVYLAAGEDGLRVVDVTSPGAPAEVGSYNTDPNLVYSDSVAVGRNHVYIDAWDGLRVLSVLDPTAPLEVGRYSSTGHVGDLVIVGDHMYVASDHYAPPPTNDTIVGLEIVDISDPSRPVYVGHTYGLPLGNDSGYASAVVVAGNTAYVGGNGRDQRLGVVDVSNKRNPVQLGVQEVPGPIHGLVTAGSFLYVAAGEGGLRAIDASNRRVPVEVGVYEQGMGLRSFGEMAVVGDILYGVDEDYQTVQISDASDPAYPTPLSFTSLITGSNHRGPAALAVADGFAYAAVSSGSCIPHFGCWTVARLRILDVSDPVTPAGVGDVVLTTVIGLIGGKTAVAVSGTRVYAAHHVTLWIVDASDPYSPTVAGSWRRPSVV